MESKRFSILLDGQSLTISATVREAGDDLLLFLHGIGCSRESFQHFWSRPEFEGYSAIAMDFPGFGESRAHDSFGYTIDDYARACDKLLENYSGRKVHIVAHSMGCAVALLFPAETLRSITSFICIEGNLTGADCGVVSRRVATSDPKKFAPEIFPEIQKQLISVKSGYFALESTIPNALYKSAQSLVAWSDSEQLLDKFQTLPCRKIYFYGDENASLPTISRIRNIQKVEIKHSGHFPMCDNPYDFYNDLYKFLSATSAT